MLRMDKGREGKINERMTMDMVDLSPSRAFMGQEWSNEVWRQLKECYLRFISALSGS